ncbi:MAG: GGDEF domain-containing protein [Eubacterium sp.]|nr:GGDEF domain-containing protein [Eubacterium sp.]
MKRRSVILAAVLCGLIIIVLTLAFNFVFAENPDRNVIELEEGWEANYDGKTYEDVSIIQNEVTEILENDVSRGKILILRRTLPDVTEIEFPTLQFKSEHCAYKVYVGNERIKEYKVDEFLSGESIGSADNYILLPTDCSGKTLTIMIYTGGEETYLNPCQHPMLGERIDLEKYIIHKNIIIISISCFLVMFGIVFAILTILLWNPTRILAGQIFASILMVDYGIYILYYSGVTFLIMPYSNAVNGEFISMFLYIPIALCLLYTIVSPTKRYPTFITASVIVSVITVFIVLHLMGIVYLDRVQSIFYAAATYLVVKIIYYCIWQMKRLELVPRLQLLALLGMSLCMVLNGIMQQLITKNIVSMGTLNYYLLAAGGTVFAMLYLVTYLYYMTESYAQQAEYDYLAYLAYADSLTGLSNRFRCEKIMSDFVYEHPEADFCIMSIDVNDLKKVNDTFGHLAGDEYLVNFARILKSRFGEYGECGRFGGDEFVVFFRRIEENALKDLIKDMETELAYHNLYDDKIKYSVSYGYAYSHEVRIPSHKNVYMMADSRMYQQKREYHKLDKKED